MKLTISPFITKIILAAMVIAAFAFKQEESQPPLNYSCTFLFSIKQQARTSAGVFTAGGVLVKTLWSGVTYTAGTHKASWDGTDNDGNLLPPARYQVRVLSNNVKYTWEGVLGNTSEKFTGPTIFRGHRLISSVAVAGNTVYCASGYAEGGVSGFRFDTQKPVAKANITPKGIEATLVTTDGKTVYWLSFEIKTNSNFIHATRVTDDSNVNFTDGSTMTTNRVKARLSVIEKAAMPDKISALAVQKNGSYLLSAHLFTSEVHVLDKTTGRLVGKLHINRPVAITAGDNNKVWILHSVNDKHVISLYELTATGTLQAAGKSITGLANPLAMAISPDDGTLLVADGGESQQLKAFNAFTGVAQWVYGQLGGYSVSAQVSNNKFYFSDARQQLSTCLAYEPDGSFWVEDAGNCRLQHFAANRTFINRVMYLPTSYSVTVNRTDATRIFSDYLEFKIDYDKPLQPGNGSWVLVNNWGALVVPQHDRKYNRLKDVITLNNGHTYALIGGRDNKRQLVELVSGAGMRLTGANVPVNYSMDNAGNLYRISDFEPGKPNVWYKKPFIKFDSDQNPLWGAETVVAATQPAATNDPLSEGTGLMLYAGEKTASGIFVAFNPKTSTSLKPHLAGVKLGGDKWLWQTAVGTPKTYRGDFPADGAFDNGNSVRYAGSLALALDRSIIWGYYGEFWKASETNKWNQVYDDGLFVGQFGITGPQINGQQGAAMFGGNAMTAGLVKDASGNAYLYHNDEATHSGVHRWKISNLSSITEQYIAVSLNYTQHGLLAEYYTSNDLDNLNRFYTGISAGMSINTVNVKGVDPLSGRLSGYVQPITTASYVFRVPAQAPVRLWVNRQLVINNWNGNNATTSAPLTLNINQTYAIKVEYRQLPSSVKSALVMWSVNGGAAKPVPALQLWPAEGVGQGYNYNLLAGLPFNGVLENGLYGWQRGIEPEDRTDKYRKWWMVQTSVRKYDKLSAPDLYMAFKQDKTVRTVTRNLGIGTLKQWKINAAVNFEGNNAIEDTDLSPNGNGGSYIEVLDDAGKVLVRVLSQLNYAKQQAVFYANNQAVFKGTRNELWSVMYTTQNLSIGTENGMGIVKYGPYPAVKVAAFDALANWARPKTLRFYFWSRTKNSGRVVDIENLEYTVVK